MDSNPQLLKETNDVVDFVFEVWTATDKSLQDGKFELKTDAFNYIGAASKFPAAIMGLSEVDDEQVQVIENPDHIDQVVAVAKERLVLDNKKDEEDFEEAFRGVYTAFIRIARVTRRKRQNIEA